MRMPDGYVFLTHPDRKATRVDLEAIELVKCANCKYWVTGWTLGTMFHRCEQDRLAMRETYGGDWCCWAEKRESEDEI